MSRYKLFVGGAIVAVLALAATTVAFGLTAQEDRGRSKPHVEYALAGASTQATLAVASAQQVAVISPSLVVRRPAAPGRFPETLALVAVGTLLIGLAAAVRHM